MKKLTKIKLINWHLFSNQTVDIQGNSLVTGENGAGKSTLLDAIQYLLVGGKSSAKFNIAATDNAKRDLEGYIKGHIGAENKEYLRPNDCITHLCLEFNDAANNTTGVVGCVLELPKGGTLKERFYILEDTKVHENMFVENKFPRDYKGMKAYFKSIDTEFKTFDSQKDYRNGLARFFGLDAKKYSRVVPKALAFKPMDLQNFFFEFLLDDDPIDIKSLKNNVEQLKKIENQIRIDKEKLEKLNKIVQAGSQLNLNLDQIDVNAMIEKIVNVDKIDNYLNTANTNLALIEQNLATLNNKKSEIVTKIDDIDSKLYNLDTAMNSNDLGITLKDYRNNLEKKGRDLDNQKEIVSNLKSQFTKEIEHFKELNTNLDLKNIKAFVKYYLTNEESIDVTELNKHLIIVNQDVQKLTNEARVKVATLETAKNELSRNLNAIKEQLERTKRFEKNYPPNVVKVLQVINEKLSKQYEKDVKIKPLCDLIDIVDPKWRNAIEGFIVSQKYNLIVEPDYFDDALEIYDAVKFELGLYGVGLVDVAKLTNFTTFTDDTLAGKIKTTNNYARLYVNMLLSNVKCVENVLDLKKYSRAITPTCMTYGSYTASQLNPNSYRTPVIGNDAAAIQAGQLKANFEEGTKQLRQIYDEIEIHNQVVSLIGDSKLSNIIANNQTKYLEELNRTKKEYTQIEEEIQKLSISKDLSSIESQISSLKQEKLDLVQDREKNSESIGAERAKQANILNQITEFKVQKQELEKEQRTISEENSTKLTRAQSQYSALKTKFGTKFDQILRSLNESTTAIKNQNVRQENELLNQMRNYCQTYHFGAAVDVSELIEFEKEQVVIRDHHLVEYEQEAYELRKNSEIGFREEFVNKLKASIENAQTQIEDLNSALDGKRFGSDSYRLVTRPSDDPDFKQYYNIIMNNDAIETNSLFTENLTKKNEIILMELFNKIASTDPENDKFTLQYLDYRHYMSYDIEIINVNGNMTYFSKVDKKKSGGETQVPYYIIIAASFQQLLTRNKRQDSGCLVLFDEAFNNMDEARIEAMLKFYNSLSIQLFISVPPVRIPYIINYVDTTVGIIKDNDYSIIAPFIEKGK